MGTLLRATISTVAAPLLLVLLGVWPTGVSAAATITVDSPADTNTSDTVLTLREAILVATGNLGRALSVGEADNVVGTAGSLEADTITFNAGIFPSGMPATISLTTALPPLSTPNDTVDGTSAGVVIDAINTEPDPAVYNCLTIQNSGITIRSLQLTDCGAGVSISSGGNNTIGPGNVIYDNTIGVLINAVSFTGNRVVGNKIGTTADGAAVNPNGGNTHGVWVQSPTAIGGTGAGEGNVISGSAANGILLRGSNNQVQGNKIGTDAAGSVDLGNGINGVLIDIFVANNAIGGSTAAARNVISGNNANGVRITNAGGSNNEVQGNYIGTDATGAADLGNSFYGVEVTSGSIGIGGEAGAGNVISANDQGGVHIASSSANSNFVQGNMIGTNVGGSQALGNTGPGIVINAGADNNLIGGSVAGLRNVISGNSGPGVGLSEPGTSENVIRGNHIGTNAGGTAAVGNGGSGVRIDQANGSTIGGSNAEDGNLISGNSQNGVEINGASATVNSVNRNFIGTQADGASPLGNGSNGVLITGNASANTISGGVGSENIVAFNTGAGVWVASGTGNNLNVNSIHSNGGLGVDLGVTGVTANDPGDPDTGANNLQNFPLVSSALTTGSSLAVQGSLNSIASASIGVSFYANSVCDGSGNGEGQTHLGALVVMTDATGNVSFSTSLAVSVAAGQSITATATSTDGTSEFSLCRVALQDSDADTVADVADNCPNWPNAAQNLPPWPVPPDDPDCDSFNTPDENHVTTGPFVHCGTAAWPADINDNGFSDTFDLTQLTGRFGQAVPSQQPPRYDIYPSGFIDTADISRMTAMFGRSCAP